MEKYTVSVRLSTELGNCLSIGENGKKIPFATRRPGNVTDTVRLISREAVEIGPNTKHLLFLEPEAVSWIHWESKGNEVTGVVSSCPRLEEMGVSVRRMLVAVHDEDGRHKVGCVIYNATSQPIRYFPGEPMALFTPMQTQTVCDMKGRAYLFQCVDGRFYRKLYEEGAVPMESQILRALPSYIEEYVQSVDEDGRDQLEYLRVPLNRGQVLWYVRNVLEPSREKLSRPERSTAAYHSAAQHSRAAHRTSEHS